MSSVAQNACAVFTPTIISGFGYTPETSQLLPVGPYVCMSTTRRKPGAKSFRSWLVHCQYWSGGSRTNIGHDRLESSAVAPCQLQAFLCSNLSHQPTHGSNTEPSTWHCPACLHAYHYILAGASTIALQLPYVQTLRVRSLESGLSAASSHRGYICLEMHQLTGPETA